MMNRGPYVEIPSPSRRRVTENDGEFRWELSSRLKSPAASRESAATKANLNGISQRHIRVILECAAGKDLAEIAREEKSSRGTILRILRTAPFTLLEIPGIIGPT
jgi:DNA-binding NarL/FixJ family response regulator